MAKTKTNENYLINLLNTVSKEQLEECFVQKLMKKGDIACQFGITVHGVNILLNEYNIKRDISKVRSDRNLKIKNVSFENTKKKIPYDTLYNYYIVEDHGYEETYKHFNITEWTFDRLLKVYQIKKDRSKSFKKGLDKRINKYGIDNLNNWKQGQQTRIDNSGSLEESYREGYLKQVKTMLERYNVGCFFLSEDIKSHRKKKYSQPNEKFRKLLDCYGFEYEREYVLNNKSFDFKIGTNLIEINPLITHNINFNPYNVNNNYKGLDIKYHLEKTKLAEQYGFRCIHVWPWDNPVKILELISQKEKIYARKCIVKEIELKECKEFLNKYHLQGYARCNIKIGLYYNNVLVSVMTFSKPRYNPKYEYELIRYASSYNVVGGAEKLFSYFLNNYNPTSIISYCDNSKFKGNIYLKLGFKLKYKGIPTRHWCNEKLEHYTDGFIRKHGFSRIIHACSKEEDNLDTNDNYILMRRENFLEVFDCGQSVYIWNK